MRLGLISSQAFSIVNFRGPLVREWTKRRVKVYALAPDYTPPIRQAVAALGAEPVDISLGRFGFGPVSNGQDLIKLTSVLRRLRLDATFSYFIKPVIFGLAASKLAGVPRRFALIEGGGYVFTDSGRDTIRKKILRKGVTQLYRLSLRHAERLFVLNRDDEEFFDGSGLISPQKVTCIGGIGVDLGAFQPVRQGTGPIVFTLVARLLREKGIVDYVDAARAVKRDHPETRFILVGGTDKNPGSLSEGDVRSWVEDGVIEWVGEVADVRPWLRQSSVFVLPSYREGIPRSTQEALASGLPVITTDSVGCRETVEEGRNGFLVPVRSPQSLAAAMRRFIEQPELIAQMGEQSRKMAEERFDACRANAIILREMGIQAPGDTILV